MTAVSNTDGAAVTLQGCTGASSQKWEFSGGNVKVFGNKCLDVTGGASADGTKLQIWTCSSGNGNVNQQWSYGIWDNHLSWKGPNNKCVDLSAGSTADGNRIQIWSCSGTPNQTWNTGYMYNALPQTSQDEQFGTNNCGTNSDQNSKCQTAWINSAEDFCVWAPPTVGKIGDTERYEVSWCTKSGRGTRVIPDGTLKGVHFVKTPDYVQITGKGDFTKINIPAGDAGGELDNRGADGRGNPIGGLLFGDSFGFGQQYHEWTNFISDTEFCIRACRGPDATKLCNHIYDEMGCYWNMPANYDEGTFENCDGDDAQPMGVYGTSTFHQGVAPTPPPHPAPASSNCKPLPTVSASPARKRRSNGELEKKFVPKFPQHTAAPYAPHSSY
ncbi:carbohydrate-binding module family 13 protein [Macrolepiota fuliginosa MF-IS2]|uniref:Carbohydrate-binding module family 13 protein n=1 Tax=Macrolepiota fuliginosa MF-IS2 TaxID=1400762 RepID=A0A9P5WZV4_9AGAR|nr:carbohydrate-binding module family 13 protein [Macrolepiota fuliginosa MF-IS2]